MEVLEAAEVDMYKIGSGEVANLLLLQKIAETRKPVIVSSGMSNYAELDNAINLFKELHINVSVMQCVTAYPSQPEQWNLQTISEYKKRFNIPTGYSDHSGVITACLAATALGAELLEFHAVFDKRMFGPDAKASLEIDEIKALVRGVKDIKISLSNNINKDTQVADKSDLKKMFGKSLCVNNHFAAGHVISINDLEAKKPSGHGIAPGDYKQVIGKKLLTAKKQWDFITHQDLNF